MGKNYTAMTVAYTYRRPLKNRTEGMEERLGISFRRTSRTDPMVWKNSIELATDDRQGTGTMEMIFLWT